VFVGGDGDERGNLRLMLRIFFISLPMALLSGCTWLVLHDASTTTCVGDDECGAGFQCESGACVAVGADAPPGVGTVVDNGGGVVAGADGVTLTIPPLAVAAATAFVIARETATLPHDNFIASGGFIKVTPAVSFTVPASLLLTGEGSLFQRPADDGATWIPIDGAGDEVEITSTGTFARGALLEAP